MARSTTRPVQNARLLRDPKLASVLVRMMIALNDATLANTALADWTKSTDPKRRSRVRGARMYFSRIQLGHALEALDVVKEIQNDSDLLAALQSCDAKTIASFERVTRFLTEPDYKLLVRIRNTLSFHYDPKLTLRALRDVVEANPDAVSLFSLGTEPLLWHFALADDVTDATMVALLGVGAEPHVSEAADAAIGGLWDIQLVFADFAGYFIRHFAK